MTGLSPVLRWTFLAILVCALIVVPFVLWEEALVEASRAWLESPANRAMVGVVAALLLASDLALPIPSSFVSAGAVAALGPVLGALAIWVGMCAGALAGYFVGRSGGTALVRRFVGDAELARAERLAARFGSGVLVVCRGVPVLAEASVLAAGAARMRFGTFSCVTGLANLGLASAYAVLSRVGSGGASAVLVPFALGVLVPGAAIVVVRRLERSRNEDSLHRKERN